ncbi:MAG: hypothetical protein J5671_02365 [Bacteroidaceae bacterium]|nr:hypothetical protein [Bacteroidaceae bacterium]
MKKVLIGLCVFFVICVMASMCDDKNSTSVATVDVDSPEVEVDTIGVGNDRLAVIETPKKTWNFSFSQDEMTDTKNIWASLRSDNYVNQDFPYEGDTYAHLTVRYMKKYGYDVLVQIDRGQIIHNYGSSNYVSVRFDDATPKKYTFNSSADYDSETIFLNNVSDFIAKAKKANVIKLDLPLYQGGRPVFTFSVDEPLTWRTE